MAISWGPWEYSGGNGMRVGIDVSISSVNTNSSSVTFTYRVYTENQYRYSDTQTLTFGGQFDGASSFSFTNNVGASSDDGGGPQLRVTKTYVFDYGVNSYGASPGTRTFSATVSGAYNGVTPSKSVSNPIPARPYSSPNAPSNLNVSSNNDTATITWTRNPTAQKPYTSQTFAQRQQSPSGVWTDYVYTTLSATATSRTVTGMLPGYLYEFTVRANNSEGSSVFETPYVKAANAPLAPAGVNATVSPASTYIDVAISPPDMWTTGTRYLYIERSVGGGAYAVVASLLDGTTTTWRDNSPGIGINKYRARYYLDPVYTTTGLYSPYTTAAPVTTVVPPATPTAIQPTSGSTVTKPNPNLSGTIAPPSSGQSVKMEWQLAADSGFTNKLVTVTEGSGDLNSGGVHPETPSLALVNLTNGTWYVRGRAVDQYGNKSGWTSAQDFTVNTPPLPVPTTVTPANGSSVTTMTPTLGLTIVADGAGRSMRAEWQIAADNGFTLRARTITEPISDYRASGVTTEVVSAASKLTSDAATTWYIRGRVLGNDGTASAWTAAQSFTLALPAPPTPTAILPSTGSSLATSTPTLGATLGAASEGRTVRAQWQLATDNAFTASVRTVDEPSTALRVSGAGLLTVPIGQKLFQGTWYLRARAVDQYGQASAWSTAQTFTVSHKPTAAPLDPVAGKTIRFNDGNYRFLFSFSDPFPSDIQTAAQVVIERNDTGAVLYDSGKVVTGSNYLNISTNTPLIKDVNLRWKVRVWDGDDVPGNYSPYQIFALSDPPQITITSPTSGQAVPTGAPTITWTNDVTTQQVTRRVTFRKASDNSVVYDTGAVATTALSFTPPVTILQNLQNYTVTVTVVDQVGMSGSTTQAFSTDYIAPDAVPYTVDASRYDTEGFINIDWSTATPDGFFVNWTVYRKRADEMDWTEIADFTNQYTTSYQDYNATSQDYWQYAVAQTGGRSGILLESPIDTSTPAILADGTHYWLINPYDNTRSMRISNVTSDDYTDEYAEEELLIIGRGRKINQGTRFGFNGSMSAQFRDDTFMTAREKRRLLQSLKHDRVNMLLRNPFGDIITVSMGNIGVSRISGVGTSEFVDVTIPYKEVF